MLKNLLSCALVAALLVAALPFAVRPVAAQDDDMAIVTLQLTSFTATDLQEDGPLNDQYDEIVVEFGMQEFSPEGLRGATVADTWGARMRKTQRITSGFAPLGLEIPRGSSVRLTIRVWESEREQAAFADDLDLLCGLNMLGCVADLFINTDDTEFTSPGQPLYTYAELQRGVNNTMSFEWRGNFNYARYTLAYSLTLHEPTPPPAGDPPAAEQPPAAAPSLVTLPGDFGSELGCTANSAQLDGDWEPGCLLAQMHDPDGDGVYTFTTARIPAGDWQVKVTRGGTWDDNYGLNGIPSGPNVPFTVPADNVPVAFAWDSRSGVLTIEVTGDAPRAAPAAASESFRDAVEVLVRDDFTGASLGDSWHAWTEQPTLTFGVMTMRGIETWDYGVSSVGQLQEGDGALVRFRFDQGWNMMLLERNDWDSDAYQRWNFSINEGGGEIAGVYGREAANWDNYQTADLRPNTWHYLLLRVVGDGAFEAAVWAADDATHYRLHEQVDLGREFGGGGWVFIFLAHTGRLDVDWAEWLRFPSGYALPAAPPPVE